MNNREIKQFHSSIFLLPPKSFLPDLSVPGKLRLWFRSFRGYTILGCFINGICVSYVTLKHNYLNKYRFMERKDMLINPYWTAVEYRRMGFAKSLLTEITKNSDLSWKRLFAVVAADNIASINCLESAGFILIGYAVRNKWSYEMTNNSTGLKIYQFSRGIST